MCKCFRILISMFLAIRIVKSDYWHVRKQLIRAEESDTMGSSLRLSRKEQLVNDFLMDRKRKEFAEGFANPTSFLPARHIFDVRGAIERSKVFQFIRKLPKGSLLHGHNSALVSSEYLYRLTFSDDLYACVNGENEILLKFLRASITEDNCTYHPIQAMRKYCCGFDERLRKQLTLRRVDYKHLYTDDRTIWRYFAKVFSSVYPMLSYKPIFEAYFNEVLQELHDDNVFYIELRTALAPLYDLDGNVYTELEVAAIYLRLTGDFVMTHEDFLGAKLIYAPSRRVDDATMEKHMQIVKGLKTYFPKFFAGFDLVGQEDLGRPLKDFVDRLLEMKNDTNFFFHAGETNWFGSTAEDNLVDAVLLGAVRIGHGYAAWKRPEVLKMVKEKGIAIEVCPISNQVLLPTGDLRNHPANYLIANNYPIVISSDDPSFWGTKGLSYDWYMAFMGMTSRRTDLRFLKQLAINSIQYSVYDDKRFALSIWRRKWNEFIDSYAKVLLVKRKNSIWQSRS